MPRRGDSDGDTVELSFSESKMDELPTDSVLENGSTDEEEPLRVNDEETLNSSTCKLTPRCLRFLLLFILSLVIITVIVVYFGSKSNVPAENSNDVILVCRDSE